MTPVQHFAHECRIALQEAGMVHDGVTEGREVWKQEAENIIAEHIELALADAKEAETGR